jgi:hypothetical protein
MLKTSEDWAKYPQNSPHFFSGNNFSIFKRLNKIRALVFHNKKNLIKFAFA